MKKSLIQRNPFFFGGKLFQTWPARSGARFMRKNETTKLENPRLMIARILMTIFV